MTGCTRGNCRRRNVPWHKYAGKFFIEYLGSKRSDVARHARTAFLPLVGGSDIVCGLAPFRDRINRIVQKIKQMLLRTEKADNEIKKVEERSEISVKEARALLKKIKVRKSREKILLQSRGLNKADLQEIDRVVKNSQKKIAKVEMECGLTAQKLKSAVKAIVIGEVRGAEASVLYESMRAGSAGSSVLGTIHGNSAKGVLDRAVEDLGISPRAFSSTDIVVVIGLVRTPDGTRFSRKVVQVTEVRDSEGGVNLVDLFTIQPGCACAKPTAEFGPECKTVRGIAEALGMTPERIIDIVRTRAHADQIVSGDDAQARVERRADDGFRVRSNEVLQ